MFDTLAKMKKTKVAFSAYFTQKNAVQARRKLCDAYGEDALTERQFQHWFAKFRSLNFDVKNS